MSLRQQHRLNGAQGRASVLATVARLASWHNVGCRVQSAFGQRNDVVLRQPTFESLVAVCATMVEKLLYRSPLVGGEVVYRAVKNASASAHRVGSHLVAILGCPLSECIWVRLTPCPQSREDNLSVVALELPRLSQYRISVFQVSLARCGLQAFFVVRVIRLQVLAHVVFRLLSNSSPLRSASRQNLVSVSSFVALPFRSHLVWVGKHPLLLPFANSIGMRKSESALSFFLPFCACH
jgi:hypothetical protein